MKIVFVIYNSLTDSDKHFSRYKCNNLIPSLGFFSHGSCERAEIDYYIFVSAMIVCSFGLNISIRARLRNPKPVCMISMISDYDSVVTYDV